MSSAPRYVAKVKWKPYQAHRDSGIEWLGRIPADWHVTRLRFVCQVNPSKSEIDGLPEDTEVSFLPMELIGEQGTLSLQETRPLDHVWQGYTYFRDGDVVVAKITPCFENGKGALCSGLVNAIGFGTTELHVLRPNSGIDAKYVFYLTRTTDFRNLGVAAMTGVAGQQRVPDAFVKNFVVALPTYSEQRAIAAFLDRETARIDALIECKERLIALLQEKRAALISHAVTKGLDPTVPMKDSGIEWIGEIPEHWELCAFRRVVDSICDGPFGSDMKSSHYSDTGVRLIRLQNIGEGIFDDSDKAYIPIEHFLSLPGHDAIPGDLLVAALGDQNHPVARACLLPNDIETAMVKADCFRVRVKAKRILNAFAMYFLCSTTARTDVANQTRGATRERINLTGLGQLKIVLPPLNEQCNIVDMIDQSTQELHALISRIYSGIDLLREYRTALISEAVTGKIDVRELV